MMKASEIRQSFLDFFEQRGHKIVPSAPVAPQDDPTLLFTNAGMNQFKDVFLGTGIRPYKRAADSQKCIRVSGKHNDLEEVGHDTYHHTFFEMLGNWSFGDYYKEEAIHWAWELVTGVWGIPKGQLWATVFRDDAEAEKLWKMETDIAPSRILRFGDKENFWEMGETGPCGPCSEIHIDRGEGFCDKSHVPGHVCRVNAGCARFIELWNLVFIQYDRNAAGKLTPLPLKHVDTGMGFERAVAVLQGKKSNYETDIFLPVLDSIRELTGKSFGEPELLPAFCVIADHIRALSFALSDGVLPSNDGRGYVMRRLLRRASRYGRRLGMREPFLYRLVSGVADVMGKAYPELVKRAQHVTLVIKNEEERFNEVLDRGIEIFEEMASDTGKHGGKILSGADAFKLYDTYGFPLDLTQLMAREKGLDVDQANFEKEMERQRERGREGSKFVQDDGSAWQDVTAGADSEFLGYETTAAGAEIRKIRIQSGDVSLLLSRTPFYGESGGQTGDAGTVSGEGFLIHIRDTQKQGDRIVHLGTFVEGGFKGNPRVEARVDPERRAAVARNHTATHLLHRALRDVLGSHVNQAGSLVTPERLRFDFNHFESTSPDHLDDVEEKVNARVRQNLKVEKIGTSLQEAKAMGATALFGEKYGDRVRVVRIGDYSMELCGGTHLEATGEIGYFRIVKEEGIAAGVGRIEAVTGQAADLLLRREKRLLRELESALKCSFQDMPARITALQDEKKELEKKVRKAQQGAAGSGLETMLQNAADVLGVRVVASRADVSDAEELRALGDRLREKLKSGVGVLGFLADGKIQFLCVVTDDLIQTRKLSAGNIVKQVAAVTGGSGGGKPHMALAGGKDAAKFEEALRKTPEIVGSFLKA
jgi:alanyl-tRNA synthetase